MKETRVEEVLVHLVELHGKYKKPGVPELTESEISEWRQDINRLAGIN